MTDKLELTPTTIDRNGVTEGTKFDNFSNGVFEKVPPGSVFACLEKDGWEYLYDPYFLVADAVEQVEYVVRTPAGWRLLTVKAR